MSERKLKTTQETNEEQIKKTREYMKRMKKTGKEYNPAPKESKNGKVRK
jgi:hypothetical protein|tara:strand:+ start:649 stop:795 length:147 start_codon:yes stop_codon:yes gene_type:complete